MPIVGLFSERGAVEDVIYVCKTCREPFPLEKLAWEHVKETHEQSEKMEDDVLPVSLKFIFDRVVQQVHTCIDFSALLA
jgi:hypothetical protein